MTGWSGQRIQGSKLRAALGAEGAPPVRVSCRRDLSQAQLAVAALSAAGLSAAEVAERLGVTTATIRFFIHEAAERIPGHRLQARAKVIAWYCGASRHVLGADRE